MRVTVCWGKQEKLFEIERRFNQFMCVVDFSLQIFQMVLSETVIEIFLYDAFFGIYEFFTCLYV